MGKPRSGSPPRYYRLQIVLSDRDADIKAWCWENPDTCSAVIREALRAHLAAELAVEGEAPPPASARKPRAPAARPAPATAPPRRKPPAVELQPAPAVVEEPLPLPPPPEIADAAPVPAAEPAEPNSGTPDVRDRLHRLFNQNRDFY